MEQAPTPGPHGTTGGQQASTTRIRPAYHQVAEQLRTLILTGELAVGQRLPSETDFAEAFGVSRSTVREALRVLSSQSLVTTSRGVKGGSFVARPDPEDITAYLQASIRLLSLSRSVSVADLLEARVLLEAPAVRLAAQRRSREQLAAIREGLQGERHAVARKQFERHMRFHATILRASGNSLLPIMTEPVFEVLRTRFAREAAPTSFWPQVVEDHARILAHIEARDADGAEMEMRGHLLRLEGTYRGIDRLQRSSDADPATVETAATDGRAAVERAGREWGE